ncbi:CBU_0585 family protein [Kangiella sediminilitoris]|uniref:Uncharacterized protein n=1 Tax=Kangiella sediminilitoris TaxID=1144748 RepID=A0A1B3BA24_9GAMM|nr:CBU_0585 family protein [Kangiella sediminilitoris]AOE49657.1 hypothetical protein KS2013_935 [Kangiella sediminilitoris]
MSTGKKSKKNKTITKSGYKSEITQFLEELDETIHPDSPARQAEKKKYDEINEKRDNPDYEEKTSKIWKGF